MVNRIVDTPIRRYGKPLIMMLAVFLVASLSLFGSTAEPQSKPPNFTTHEDTFLIRVQCDIACTRAPGDDRPRQTKKTVQRPFAPEPLGLKKGPDGWAPLHISLWTYGEMLCLEEAKDYCEGVEIESFALKDMRSGPWYMDEKPECRERSSSLSLFSPYDSRIRGQLFSAFGMYVPDTTPKPLASSLRGAVIEKDASHNCKNLVTASICPGGKEPPCFGMINEVSVCADSFVAYAKAQKASDSELILACEQMFWANLARHEKYETLMRCPSIRSTNSCAQLVANIALAQTVTPDAEDLDAMELAATLDFFSGTYELYEIGCAEGTIKSIYNLSRLATAVREGKVAGTLTIEKVSDTDLKITHDSLKVAYINAVRRHPPHIRESCGCEPQNAAATTHFKYTSITNPDPTTLILHGVEEEGKCSSSCTDDQCRRLIWEYGRIRQYESHGWEHANDYLEERLGSKSVYGPYKDRSLRLRVAYGATTTVLIRQYLETDDTTQCYDSYTPTGRPIYRYRKIEPDE